MLFISKALSPRRRRCASLRSRRVEDGHETDSGDGVSLIWELDGDGEAIEEFVIDNDRFLRMASETN